LNESNPRRIAAVLKGKVGPAPYSERNVYSICSVSIILSNPCMSYKFGLRRDETSTVDLYMVRVLFIKAELMYLQIKSNLWCVHVYTLNAKPRILAITFDTFLLKAISRMSKWIERF
jgi:hypothetical protein